MPRLKRKKTSSTPKPSEGAAAKAAKPRGKIVRLPDISDPALERGERFETSKMIARGGKNSGHVPGTTESKQAGKST
jgi:hypothetical protein